MKLPKELKELKNRLKLELDGCDVQESSIEAALLVFDEWYKDGRDNDKKDEEYWRHWALQNIS